MTRRYYSEHPEQLPDWYWTPGLHDACITGFCSCEFPFDYSRLLKGKGQYDRNCLTLQIDAKPALYPSTIREIRFFNFTVLSQKIKLDEQRKVWWMADRLRKDGKRYILELDLLDPRSKPADFTLQIKFERAEVDR